MVFCRSLKLEGGAVSGNGQYGLAAPDDIAARLRLRINAGELGPGDKLPTERDHAAQLGVARPTLREALRVLTGEGYLTSRRGNSGGTFISDLVRPRSAWLHRVRQHPEEIVDVYEHRIALERHAAMLAADRRTEDDLATMHTAIVAAAHPASRQTFRQADHRFHLAVASAARSPRISLEIAGLRGEIFVPVDTLAYQDHFDQNITEHTAIARAIQRRDGKRAAQAMTEHLQNSLSDLLQQVGKMS